MTFTTSGVATPSDYPDFARWLVGQGINSLSLNPDTAIKTTFVIAEVETEEVNRSQALSIAS
jgi:phosphoenolpyruvate synthase/pyruvate phosphate dikinase